MIALSQTELATWIISGDLQFATIDALKKAGDPLIIKSRENHLQFDFSKVNRCDSSGLALMLSWLRLAKKNGKSIVYVNVPSSLLQIAEVCGVRELLVMKN